MDKIKSYLQRPLVTGIIGFVVGLIIGLPLLGWVVWPVKWKDADASYLRQDLKDQYLCMIVDSYKTNRDANLAAARIDSLGMDLETNPFIFDSLQQGGCSYTADDPDVVFLTNAILAGTTSGQTIQATSDVQSLFAEGTQGVAEVVPETKTATKSSTILLALLCVVFLAIGGALFYIFFIRNRKKGDKVPPVIPEEDYTDEELAYPEEAAPVKTTVKTPVTPSNTPAAHFMSTYVLGDDLYDDSFSIDAQNGEFLGECGVGISDTIGVGDPKKVTAFEVWLFDKNDIQTVTKVLMSSHAINDPATHQRLASKGEPILIEPGQQILLETATLQLEAKVIELVYGQGALPSGSFFERLTLEIAVWPK